MRNYQNAPRGSIQLEASGNGISPIIKKLTLETGYLKPTVLGNKSTADYFIKLSPLHQPPVSHHNPPPQVSRFRTKVPNTPATPFPESPTAILTYIKYPASLDPDHTPIYHIQTESYTSPGYSVSGQPITEYNTNWIPSFPDSLNLNNTRGKSLLDIRILPTTRST